MHIHWHRRDLRPTDNRGLHHAVAVGDDSVVPVFVFDKGILEHGSPVRVACLLEALDSLRTWYREHDSDLVVLHGDPSAVLPDLARAVDATAVSWNVDYSGLAGERDLAVSAALEDAGIAVHEQQDALCFEPGSITTNEGNHYSVYTYFWKKWRDRDKPDSVPAPSASDLAAVTGDPLPTFEALGFDEPEATVPSVGLECARERATTFCDGPIYRYENERDYPARNTTSRLSVDLKYGTIGIRELYEATETAHEQAPDEAARESVQTYQQQLAWREFYAHVLAFNPEVVTENFSGYSHPIEWRNDPDELEAWKAGETGYPIVDAGMRQLRTEAWVHNRVRMIVASFLTKDLLIDWREGYDWYRNRLADHDTANDTGGWQWAASTGTDAQPYFRIFNPMKQGRDYDPGAEYIKTHVAELADVDAADIHDWHELSVSKRRELAPEYPDPIVDHSERREQALAMFERARGEDE
ncbi:cryptochrome/photolyase family protein [Natrialbaceae archaeon A-chndr2]